MLLLVYWSLPFEPGTKVQPSVFEVAQQLWLHPVQLDFIVPNGDVP